MAATVGVPMIVAGVCAIPVPGTRVACRTVRDLTAATTVTVPITARVSVPVAVSGGVRAGVAGAAARAVTVTVTVTVVRGNGDVPTSITRGEALQEMVNQQR